MRLGNQARDEARISAVARTIEEETGTICVTMAADLTQAHAANMTGTSLTADGGWTKAIA